MNSFRTLLAVLLLAITGSAVAVPITFIHTGTGSGSIDGAGFGASAFVITAFGDTNDKLNQGGFADYINHLSASIFINGVGTFNFITGTRTFLNTQLVGFSRAGESADLYNGPDNVALLGWDMASSIGPVGGTGGLLQWLNSPVLTDGGQLVFDSGSSDATFQAIVGVPEPGTLVLLGLGLAAMGFGRRRKNV